MRFTDKIHRVRTMDYMLDQMKAMAEEGTPIEEIIASFEAEKNLLITETAEQARMLARAYDSGLTPEG